MSFVPTLGFYSIDIVNKRICRDLHQFLNLSREDFLHRSLVNVKIIGVQGKIEMFKNISISIRISEKF